MGEKDGKGKEYSFDGKLQYEGEYLHGEFNGKGKEYFDNGKLKYEGEYLNGKFNGKGKEYFDNGKLKFEGEYLNGKKWNGKGYNYDGEKIFEIKDGNGNIKEYDDKGILKYEGEYLNGEQKGKGYNYDGEKIFEIKDGNGNIKEYDDKGILKYEGEYLNGERKREDIDYNNKLSNPNFNANEAIAIPRYIDMQPLDPNQNIVNVTFLLFTGHRTNMVVNGSISIEQLIKKYIYRLGLSENVIEKDIMFMYNGQQLDLKTKEDVNSKIGPRGGHILVYDLNNIIYAWKITII